MSPIGPIKITFNLTTPIPAANRPTPVTPVNTYPKATGPSITRAELAKHRAGVSGVSPQESPGSKLQRLLLGIPYPTLQKTLGHLRAAQLRQFLRFAPVTMKAYAFLNVVDIIGPDPSWHHLPTEDQRAIVSLLQQVRASNIQSISARKDIK